MTPFTSEGVWFEPTNDQQITYIDTLLATAPYNYSVTFVPEGTTQTIPLYQQMIVWKSIAISGTLNIKGAMVVLNG